MKNLWSTVCDRCGVRPIFSFCCADHCQFVCAVCLASEEEDQRVKR